MRHPEPMRYHAAACLTRPEIPSPGDLYALSGRAAVDALDGVRTRNLECGPRAYRGRSMPSSEEREDLWGRIKALGIPSDKLSSVLGLAGRCSITRRLRGETRWGAGEYERLSEYVAEREGV
ncbi:MAG: hypothetical protein P1P84_02810 [Deferrisomatales bacterium]|nr:hypothetical protein [Deferrisomatales bacterium]